MLTLRNGDDGWEECIIFTSTIYARLTFEHFRFSDGQTQGSILEAHS